jgi:hypothetical protein
MNLKDQLLFDSNSKAEHNAITASLFKVNLGMLRVLMEFHFMTSVDAILIIKL